MKQSIFAQVKWMFPKKAAMKKEANITAITVLH
jgi:hypothetical protein